MQKRVATATRFFVNRPFGKTLTEPLCDGCTPYATVIKKQLFWGSIAVFFVSLPKF